MSAFTKVLIVDDHPVVRNGIREMLSTESDIVVVGEADGGEKAFQLAVRIHPDVVLMDLRMNEGNGVEATRTIVTHMPDVRVLVLTTYDTDSDIIAAVEAGAVGYLLKDAPRAELLSAIRAIASGKSALSPAVERRLTEHVTDSAVSKPTGRELEVLLLASQGLSNSDIGEELHLSQATVKYHLAQIFRKLGVHDRTAAVTAAITREWIRA